MNSTIAFHWFLWVFYNMFLIVAGHMWVYIHYQTHLICERICCSNSRFSTDIALMSSFTNGIMCSNCLTRFPLPFYRCKTCNHILCETCSIGNSGFCGHGGLCNGPDKDDYVKRCRKRPAAGTQSLSSSSSFFLPATQLINRQRLEVAEGWFGVWL